MISNAPYMVYVIRQKATITVERVEVYTVNSRGVIQSTSKTNPERFLPGTYFREKVKALAHAERIRQDEINFHQAQIERLNNIKIRVVNK